MPFFSYSGASVASAVGGTLLRSGSRPIEAVTIHSEEFAPNALFFPLCGTTHDGHDFLVRAIQNGVAGICFSPSRFPPSSLPTGDYTAIAVEDPLSALGRLAAFHRSQIPTKIIAVTGSVGKTTTKQFLLSVFSQDGKTVATEGNLNNEIGVPLTLLSIPHDARYGIVEMGMSHAGELRYLSSLARPNAAIITNIGTSHIGNLGSRSAIAAAKKEIFAFLQPDGVRILCGNEPLLWDLTDSSITVASQCAECDYNLTEYWETDSASAFHLVCHGTQSVILNLPTQGKHLALDAAFAYATAVPFGLHTEQIQAGLLQTIQPSLRQSLYDFTDLRVIADCYNAAPESMEAAVAYCDSLGQKEGRRTVAILGDMLELGESATSLHRAVGQSVARSEIALLVTFGTNAAELGRCAKAIRPSLQWHCVADSAWEELLAILKKKLRKNDLILLKASRALRLERLLPILKEWRLSNE